MPKYKYERFGVMIDMSRNAVMNLNSLKNFITVLKKIGYNCVMLYTEDTYEIKGEPFFGYLRGRYTAEELREIDDYAFSIGVEVIPCIQTLAKNENFRSKCRSPKRRGVAVTTTPR